MLFDNFKIKNLSNTDDINVKCSMLVSENERLNRALNNSKKEEKILKDKNKELHELMFKEKTDYETFVNDMEVKVIKLIQENSLLNGHLKQKQNENRDYIELEKNIEALLQENVKLSKLLDEKNYEWKKY